MKVLVVGGAGYIGGAVIDQLQQTDHSVRVFDALLYEESYRKPVNFVYGDIRDLNKLRKHLDWADVVIWLAALVGDGACALNPEVTVELNQESVERLAQHYDKRIIFLSTCSVYGAQDGILDEDAPTNPLSVYAVTKLAAEGYLKNKNALIFRLGTIFGVGDLFSRIRLDLVVNVLTVRAALEGKIAIFGGDQFRPLIHVRDVANTIVENVDTEHTGVYNLHRQNVRIIDLAYQVRNHFPDLEIQMAEMKFQDTRNYRVSSDKAHRELGFKAAYSIDDGIEEVKELIESRRIKNVQDVRYTNQSFLATYKPHLQTVS